MIGQAKNAIEYFGNLLEYDAKEIEPLYAAE
jgi:hypothetical protein